MLIKKVVHVVLFLMLMYSFSALHVSAQPPIISIEPSSLSVQPGQLFSLDVRITNVTDLYAFQFDVVFVPTILSAVSIAEGALLPTGGATIFFPGAIDNTGGTIAAITDSIIADIPGVVGTGTLATINFQALTPGTSPITLANVILLDSTLTDIPASIANGSITVVPVTPIPTLSSLGQALVVIVVGVTGLLFLRRRLSLSELAKVF